MENTSSELIPNKIYNSFEDLEVWQKAHELMLEVYKFTKLLPAEEKYNRITQLRRSSSSVSANIAEGFGRFYWQENISFCRKARGSLEETKNHLIAARDLNQAPATECNRLINQCDTVRKLLNGYIRYLNNQK